MILRSRGSPGRELGILLVRASHEPGSQQQAGAALLATLTSPQAEGLRGALQAIVVPGDGP